jgi:methylated-DNA-protein-cysteine methyltransferase-like protein
MQDGSRASSSHDRIYAVVRRIPAGSVATYGQVAELAGLGGQARLVGYAMSALPNGTTVPWHRVINAQGKVSPRSSGPSGGVTQRLLLEREGVRFSGGRVSLEKFRWKGR